jgi:homogentisate 1,2-dioxygenase
MIERRFAGLLPAKPHTAFRDAEGHLYYEEMFTRGGFSGPFTYFYHRKPITPTRDVALSERGFHAPTPAPDKSPLKRRLYDSNKIPSGGQPIDSRVPVLFNRDVTVYLVRATVSDDAYYANGDGDELWYVQDGAAKLESPCGMLDVKSGDYVWVPHGMLHRWHVTGELRAMVFEAPDGIVVPADFRNPVGQLKMDAPYTHRDFVHPEGALTREGPTTLLIKKAGVFSRYTMAHPPMDVVGWDGFVYPWAFAIEKYQPKTGLVHLPPTIHSTFASKGFLVCSFVPRLVDFHPEAIPCPYPHSSVDCDEIILYLRGNFTSRRGVGPGCISLHPAGISHGPHPGAYEASIGSKRTDELAVMCDTFLPLAATAQAKNIEVDGYHESWA